MQTSFLRYFICGFLMGTADTIPGVSGGTIAFITGIYKQLLDAIQSVNGHFARLIFRGRIKEALSLIPWNFCIPLVLGIGTAIFSLAKIVVYLLHTYPSFLWAFFFGLILASLFFLLQELKQAQGFVVSSISLFFCGIGLALWLTFAEAMTLSHSPIILFMSGFIAICAMILPGISGSFLLVLLGQYQFVLQSISTLQFDVIATFGLGALCGLLSFSRLISYCLEHYFRPCLAFLSGILAGSLVMLWPYTECTSQSPTTLMLITGLLLLGLSIPLVLHRIMLHKR
ncbi:MAG: DUF368 domain-containing protein [Pseudomonadota bacterium]